MNRRKLFVSERDHREGAKARRECRERNAIPFISSRLRAFAVYFLSVGATSVMLLPATASAHAFLDRAEPRVGAEVRHSPGAVKIWFTEQPEHAFSAIRVFDAQGKEVDKKDTHTDPDDAKALDVSIPADLPPGTYKVEWKVLSIDTHRTQGDFKFTIKP
jgi:copper resistance protein C